MTTPTQKSEACLQPPPSRAATAAAALVALVRALARSAARTVLQQSKTAQQSPATTTLNSGQCALSTNNDPHSAKPTLRKGANKV
jgi:hypothetical protein